MRIRPLLLLLVAAALAALLGARQQDAPREETWAMCERYRNPRVYNVEYTFEMTPDPATIDRQKDLKVWAPIPREWGSQKNVQVLSVVPEPHARYDDPEYGNRIYYWDFGKEPERSSYQFRVMLRLESYEIHECVDTARVEPYDTTRDEYRLYTRSGHTTHITPEIREMARIAVGDERNPYLKAKRIWEFVQERMRYEQTMERGIDFLLTTAVVDEETGESYFQGACGQHSALFVALARAAGIPARSVEGFVGWAPHLNQSNSQMFSPPDTMVSEAGFAGAEHHGLGPHMWAEFFVPGYGWIPSDPTGGGMGFGFRPNWKVIMGKGRDVPLGPDAPQAHHEGYGFQWVPISQGRVDDFQSPVWNIGKIRRARVNVYHTLDPYPADALADYLWLVPEMSEGETELAGWKKRNLEDLDNLTRDFQDRDVQSSMVFEEADGPYLAETYDTYAIHMLRELMGDEKFYRLVNEYLDLRTHTSQPVATSRFVDMAEAVHGAPLTWFFEQWKPENGLPHLRLEDVRREERGETWLVRGSLIQSGRVLFRVPVPIAVETEKGESLRTVWHAERRTDFEIDLGDKPIGLRVDPDHDLLTLRRMPPRLSRSWGDTREIMVVYGTVSEDRANREMAEWLHATLGVAAENIKADTAATPQDLETRIIVLLGRPATNTVSMRFRDHFFIRFAGESFSYNGISYSKPSQGAAQIVDHPLRARGGLVLYAGLSEAATLAIRDLALRDLDILDAPHSYVLYEGDATIATGDWPGDSDLIWKFEQ